MSVNVADNCQFKNFEISQSNVNRMKLKKCTFIGFENQYLHFFYFYIFNFLISLFII